MYRIVTAFGLAALIIAVDCIAQARNADDEILAENASVKLTRADYETDLMRVPPEMRPEFAASPKRLTLMLNNLLIDKTLAKEARDAAVDRDPEIARRLALEVDRFLAQAMLGKIEHDAGAEFEKKSADFLAKAREIYVLNKEKYRAPEQVSASHILFDPTRHGGSDAALALAKEARAKIVAGADFAALASEVSDDPNAKTDGGKLGFFGPKKMDPEFSKAAYELKNVGDVSEPVQSSFGWHVIRLDGRRPARDLTFEQASKQIMQELRARYVTDARNAKVEAISHDPAMKVNQAAVDALVVKLPELPRGAREPNRGEGSGRTGK
jgi:peptidyl-prolyl cis-trans isomerase C